MKAYVTTFILMLFAMTCFSEPAEYILQPGDVVTITVVEHPEFSGKNKIRPDGRINYPVIGEIDVASLTCAQLVQIMQGKLSSYVNNPVVSISIDEYYSNKIYIIGAVRSPGQFQIYEPIDVVKAIAMCGGYTNDNVKTLKIIRADGSVLSINAHDLLNKDKYDPKEYVLYPGDSMYVPETHAWNWLIFYYIIASIAMAVTAVVAVNNMK
jgi:polysaccharide biosynthesis/export protein